MREVRVRAGPRRDGGARGIRADVDVDALHRIWLPPHGLRISPASVVTKLYRVAVVVDAEAGQVERSRVEGVVGRIDVVARAVVVAGRVGRPRRPPRRSCRGDRALHGVVPPSAPTATTVIVLRAEHDRHGRGERAAADRCRRRSCPPALTQTSGASLVPATVTVAASVVVAGDRLGDRQRRRRREAPRGVTVGHHGRRLDRPARVDRLARGARTRPSTTPAASPSRCPRRTRKPYAVGSGWSQTCSGIMYPSLAVSAIVSRYGSPVRPFGQLVLAPLARQQRPEPPDAGAVVGRTRRPSRRSRRGCSGTRARRSACRPGWSRRPRAASRRRTGRRPRLTPRRTRSRKPASTIERSSQCAAAVVDVERVRRRSGCRCRRCARSTGRRRAGRWW